MRTDRPDTRDGATRAGAGLLVLAAVAAVLLAAPTAVQTVLSLAAVSVVAQRTAAARGRGSADAVLVAFGGVLVVLVLTGLLLDLVGVPLAPRGWALALGAVGLAGALAPLPHSERRPIGDLVRAAPWAVACAAVAVVAISASVRSAGTVDVAPVALSLGQVGGGHAQVLVQSEKATGLLELRADNGNGSSLSYPLFRLPAGGSRITDVLLPVHGRTTVTISNPGQSEPLRTLIVAS